MDERLTGNTLSTKIGNTPAGQLKPEYYADYATYFVKWIQAFQATGIPINAITVQNEPLDKQELQTSLVMKKMERTT